MHCIKHFTQYVPGLSPAAGGAAAGAWVSNLTDSFKYVLGSKYLPTGFEMGFNHYAGAYAASSIDCKQCMKAGPRQHVLQQQCLMRTVQLQLHSCILWLLVI